MCGDIKRAVSFALVLIFILGLALIYFEDKRALRNPSSTKYNLGVSIHPGLKEQDIKAISDAGFDTVRIDIFWSNVEKQKGVYDYKNTGYDELDHLLTKYNLKPYYILAYSNPLYEDGRFIKTERSREAFNKFVTATVNRYKNQNVIWEIWNEPNLELFWESQPSEDDYFKLVQMVAPTIKSLDDTGKVVAPALAGLHTKSMAWLEQLLSKGTLNYIDAISVHPYRDYPPESVSQDYAKLRKMIKKYTNREIPVISGEWGYSTAGAYKLNEKEQADHLVRMFLINMANDIPLSIWYDWKNDGLDKNNKEHNFGLMWYSSNPKLSFLAMQTLSRTMEGYTFVTKLETEDPSNYILKFKNQNGKQIIVFWTTDSNHNSNIPIDSGKGQIVSMLGAVRNVEWKNEVELNFSSSPGYLIID